MTVHILTLPHTDIDPTWSTCAFTQKIRHLVTMLESEGIPTIVYGSDTYSHNGGHNVIYTHDDRKRWFGEEDYRDKVFDVWDANAPCWWELNVRSADAIRKAAQPGDVIHLSMGYAHKAVATAIPHIRSAELGIGYEASFSDFRVFESYAWMHHTYGRQNIHDGRFYDAVIPNAFDPDQFAMGPDNGYLLFLGRLTPRKGLKVIEEIAKNYKVISAGQGDETIPGVEHLGVVGPQARKELLSDATALLCPTSYIEPFGGVAVEAQMSGIPVITVDWGAFTETVETGITGYKCFNLSGFLAACELAPILREKNGEYIRAKAMERWSLDAVAPLYRTYLNRLATLDQEGWYA